MLAFHVDRRKLSVCTTSQMQLRIAPPQKRRLGWTPVAGLLFLVLWFNASSKGLRNSWILGASGTPEYHCSLFTSAVLHASAPEPTAYSACQLSVQVATADALLLITKPAAAQAALRAVDKLVRKAVCKVPELAAIADLSPGKPCSSGGSAAPLDLVSLTPSLFSTASINPDTSQLTAWVVITNSSAAVDLKAAAGAACKALPQLLGGGKLAAALPSTAAAASGGAGDGNGGAVSVGEELKAEVVSGRGYPDSKKLRHEEGQFRQLAFEAMLKAHASKLTWQAVLLRLELAPAGGDNDGNGGDGGNKSKNARFAALKELVPHLSALAPEGARFITFHPEHGPASSSVYVALLFTDQNFPDSAAAAVAAAQTAPAYLNAHGQLPGSYFVASPVRNVAILSGSYPQDSRLDWYNSETEDNNALTASACFFDCIKTKKAEAVCRKQCKFPGAAPGKPGLG